MSRQDLAPAPHNSMSRQDLAALSRQDLTDHHSLSRQDLTGGHGSLSRQDISGGRGNLSGHSTLARGIHPHPGYSTISRYTKHIKREYA